MTFVKFETPEVLTKKTLDIVDTARGSGKIRIGINEVTKAVERQKAKLIVMAEDVDPQEIMLHIPILCDEKKIPYAYVKTKADLGKAAGLKVGTSSIAVADEGKARKDIEALLKELEKLKK